MPGMSSSNRRKRAFWTVLALVLLFASADLAAGYVLHGVPPNEEESEGVTIKATATVLALAGASVLSLAWLRFGRSNSGD